MSVLAKLPWVRRYALENERLRSKLNEGGLPDPIETVRGAGYRIRVE